MLLVTDCAFYIYLVFKYLFANIVELQTKQYELEKISGRITRSSCNFATITFRPMRYLILISFFVTMTVARAQTPAPGAYQTSLYFPVLQKHKAVGLTGNATSHVEGRHLIDTLIVSGINLVRLFAPEHGFRGEAEAGELISDQKDGKTGLPIISLYGKSKKPTVLQMKGLDCMVFDIQDVGVRFFTYISTLHYIMEACAEAGIPLIVLDRPNPNADYYDGPVLEPGQQSFVGMHAVPIVYGMTIGEYALMINGEGWLPGGLKCNLTVIPVRNYTRASRVELPVRPSPNLPNYRSQRLYPSLCLFEGTSVSVGRGTDFPFQVAGYPDSTFGRFTFVPESRPGFAASPLHQDRLCYGIDLRTDTLHPYFTLKFVLDFYQINGNSRPFFTNPAFFDKLAGTPLLRQQILQGLGEDTIRLSWETGLGKFSQIRAKYLIYP